MNNNLFIPSKIRVGFQTRHDTFTGKLAYVIYYDEKGKIRKEKSWSGWCNADIETLEIDNDPRNGYIFNKGVKRDGHWGSGRSVIRVYDPRDFEFEISVDNLIGLLMHSDVSKRDIVEECVFAWTGGDLVLLPTNSQEYTDSVEYTAKQSLKVSARDLVVGRQYGQKKHDEILTYIGRYPWYTAETDYNLNKYNARMAYQKDRGKKHIFVDSRDSFFPTPATTLSHEISTNEVGNIAESIDKYFKTEHSQRIVDFMLMPPILEQNKSGNTIDVALIENGDRIIRVYMYYYWYADRKTIDFDKYNLSVYLYDKQTEEDGSLVLVAVTTPRSMGSSWNRSVSDQERLVEKYRNCIKNNVYSHLQTQGIPTNDVSRDQVFDAFVEMGYGDLHSVLTDGTTVKHTI